MVLRGRDRGAAHLQRGRSALQVIDLASVRSNGYSFQVEMGYRAVQHGLKSVEVPIHFAERTAGESKMSLRVQLESALLPFQLSLRAARKAGRAACGGEQEHQRP